MPTVTTGTTIVMDPLVDKLTDQNFANMNQGSQHAFRRLMDTSDFISTQTQLQFVGQQSLYAAKAATNLDRNPLADAILQQRSARDQPNFIAGSGGGTTAG